MTDEFKLENSSVSIYLTLGKDVDIFEYKTKKITTIVYGYPYHLEQETWLTAEAILKIDQQKGLSFTDNIDGVFSIVILGKENVLITDPIGVYNLFLLRKEGRVLVSNQLKYLIQHDSSKSIDEKGINDFIYLGYIIGENTIFSNIKKSLPGTIEYLGSPNKAERYFELVEMNSSLQELRQFLIHI